MSIKRTAQLDSSKDEEVFLLEVLEGKLLVKKITEDFVIINTKDIPSNRADLINFNEKYLIPNGTGVDINSLTDEQVGKFITAIKETISKDIEHEIMTECSGYTFNSHK